MTTIGIRIKAIRLVTCAKRPAGSEIISCNLNRVLAGKFPMNFLKELTTDNPFSTSKQITMGTDESIIKNKYTKFGKE
jgi:hypothetical protein